MRLKTYMLNALFCTVILNGFSVAAQNDTNQSSRLFVRYRGAASGHRISEDVLSINQSLSRSGSTLIAVRVCSEAPLPLAAANAINPFTLADLLGGYGYPPGQVIFLRSEDCSAPSDDASTPATEVWVIPEGATLPPHAEALKSDEISLKSLGRRPLNRGARDYRVALNKLIQNLRANPANVGVVNGYFLKRPHPALRRRMSEVARILKRSGLPRGRYLVRTRYWYDETWIYPPDSEPIYPDVLLVQVSKDSKRK